MAQLDITLPSLHQNQAKIIHCNKRFIQTICGRRFGKTRGAVVLAVKKALEGKRVWWLAPTYSMANEGYLQIKSLALQIPDVVVRESEKLLTFPTGGSIQSKSTDNPQNLRGAGLDFVVLDEAAFMSDEVWYRVIRPALADRRGGAAFLSTPIGKNWYYYLYLQALQSDEWQVFHFTTADNPFIHPDEIEAARIAMSERAFKEEILAEFVDEGAVFRKLTEAQAKYQNEPLRYSGECAFGVDWAQMHDFTVITVIDVNTKRILEIDRFNQVAWQVQRDRLKALYDKWQPMSILAELNSIGSPNVEALQAENLPVVGFTTTNESKNEIIQALSLAFEKEEIALPDNPVLISELMSYQAERLSSGKWRYNAPSGMHDDCVIATALAYWQALNANAHQMTVTDAPDIFYTYRG